MDASATGHLRDVKSLGVIVMCGSNHAMEPTATRRAFTFCVTSTFPLRPMLASGGRRSSYSR